MQDVRNSLEPLNTYTNSIVGVCLFHCFLYPSDDLVQLCVDYLKAYPALAGAGLCVPFVLLFSFLLLFREGEEPKSKKSKKKKKEEQKEKKESKKET